MDGRRRSVSEGPGGLHGGATGSAGRAGNRSDTWSNVPKRDKKKKGTQFSSTASKATENNPEQKVLQRPANALKPLKTGTDGSFFAETQRDNLVALFEEFEDNESSADSDVSGEEHYQDPNVDTSTVNPQPLKDIRQRAGSVDGSSARLSVRRGSELLGKATAHARRMSQTNTIDSCTVYVVF